MTKSEVSRLVAVLMACYPNARVPDGTVVAYEQFLQELEHDRAQQAVAHIVRTSKFMPTIAEIVTAYEALQPQPVAPMYQLWQPARGAGPLMKPSELKAAIDDFLAGKNQQ